MKVRIDINDDCEIRKKIDKFWELVTMGEWCQLKAPYTTNSLKNYLYHVRLPFKEKHSFIEYIFEPLDEVKIEVT